MDMFKMKKKVTLEDVLNRHYHNLAFLLTLAAPEEGYDEIHMQVQCKEDDKVIIHYIIKGKQETLDSNDRMYQTTKEATETLLKLKHEVNSINETLVHFAQTPFQQMEYTLAEDGTFEVAMKYEESHD